MGVHHELIKKVLPLGSRRRERVRRLLGKTTAPPAPASSATYDEWIRSHEADDIIKVGEAVKEAKQRPLLSVLVPCWNTPDKYLLPLIDSILDQQYDNWELVIADGSTIEDRQEAVKAQSLRDKRIRYVRVGENLGIIGNTNIALEKAKGTFVGFIDHDDTLAPHALASMVLAINDNPKADVLYSDEDKLSDDGKVRQLPFFKPDWSPELLLGVNYITHFTVARRSLVQKVGGLRPGYEAVQDYDLMLRMTENTKHIIHVPKILYHWRLAEGSTAIVPGEKNYADINGRKLLRDTVKRRKIKAEVVGIPERPTNNRLRYALPAKQPLVSIIIPYKDKIELLKVLMPSIFKSTYKNYEVILISNNSTDPETFAYSKKVAKDKRVSFYEWDHPFNYSKINNFGRSKASKNSEYLVFLNNDTEVLTFDWLEELVGVAAQPGIGAVAPLLTYPDGRVQHAGIVVGMKIMAGLPFRLRQPHEWTDFGLALWPRNYLAVIGACMVVKADRFDSIGCFDERVLVGGSDVIPCIKLHEKGYRNVYWPFARLTHYENTTVVNYDSSAPQGDYDLSLQYYGPYHKSGDPYFNPNLDPMNEQIGIRSQYDA